MTYRRHAGCSSKIRRSGAQRGASENNFGQRFSVSTPCLFSPNAPQSLKTSRAELSHFSVVIPEIVGLRHDSRNAKEFRPDRWLPYGLAYLGSCSCPFAFYASAT